MSERVPVQTENDTSYWESWGDTLGLPQGAVFDSRSYQDALWNKQRLENRAHNVQLSHYARINGQVIHHGDKR